MSLRRTALVLGSDNGSFLSVVRSLGRRGIEVHIGWCPSEAPAARSRYVAAAHHLPRPGADDSWVTPFAQLMARERFDLVVPTNDPTLIPLQLARDRLEPHGRIALLGEPAFSVAFDKVRTRELAQAHDVPVAPGQILTGAHEVGAALAGRAYPLVVKPHASYGHDDLERRHAVVRVYDAAAAREAILERLRDGPVVLEENVTGSGWGLEILAAEGEILLSQQHERLHEPLQGGASTYRRTVPRDPGLMDAAARLMRALDYTGVAMLEFKGDPASGHWVLIEINPRFWGSLPLSLAAGIDFPFALWQLLVEGRTDVPDTYATGIYARNVKRDLKWLWLNLRADRRDPVLATAPLHRVAGELIHIVRGREHADQFPADDPAPGLTEFRQLGREAADRARGRMLSRPPLEQRARRRARRALGEARTVLFVCAGNICRSPFAAAVARARLPDELTVLSAGTSDEEGRAAPRVAREVARSFGVELDGHRSQPVTAELMDRADAVFAFDDRGWATLRRRFPAARPRIHLLGALGDGPLVIGDPITGGEATFRRCYEDIAQALWILTRPARLAAPSQAAGGGPSAPDPGAGDNAITRPYPGATPNASSAGT